MTQDEDAKLAPPQELEESMAEITCVECGTKHFIDNHGFRGSGGMMVPTTVLQGVLVCRGKDYNHACKSKTVFELTGNSTTFAPGKLFENDLRGVTPEVRDLFEEAVLCFYGKAHKGVVGMCRSAVEQSLDEKNAPGPNLYEKIEGVPDSFLGPEQKTAAHATRLSGRNALHRLAQVTQAQALTALNVTIDLVNHISAQAPLPASQSGTGSNAP